MLGRSGTKKMPPKEHNREWNEGAGRALRRGGGGGGGGESAGESSIARVERWVRVRAERG